MTLISSISGIRGSVNGASRRILTAVDVVVCGSADGAWVGGGSPNTLKNTAQPALPSVVVTLKNTWFLNTFQNLVQQYRS